MSIIAILYTTIQINRLEDHGAIILVDEYRLINLVGPKLHEFLHGWISKIYRSYECQRIRIKKTSSNEITIKEMFHQTINQVFTLKGSSIFG